MIFEPLPVEGAYLVRLEPRGDERGFFARTWCEDEFRDAGIGVAFVQQSMARSNRAGTLRGLHLQLEPYAEAKMVRCIRGAIFDVFVDLREGSPTYLRTASVRIDADRGDALYIPAGCAHGYQTLVDDTDVLYAMSERYAPGAARGIIWNDAQIGIAWPLAEPILSDADRGSPSLAAFLAARAAQRETAAAAANAVK